MLSVLIALICDYGVGSSWLCGSLSYLEGLIIFNPLDVSQPELRAGGQLMPTEPNRQLIIVVNKGVTTKSLHMGKKAVALLLTKKEKKTIMTYRRSTVCTLIQWN